MYGPSPRFVTGECTLHEQDAKMSHCNHALICNCKLAYNGALEMHTNPELRIGLTFNLLLHHAPEVETRHYETPEDYLGNGAIQRIFLNVANLKNNCVGAVYKSYRHYSPLYSRTPFLEFP